MGLNVIPGWNTYVCPHYIAARNALPLWVANGRPLGSGLDSAKRILRSRFQSALWWCKKNMESLRTSALASSLGSFNFRDFWKNVASSKSAGPQKMSNSVGSASGLKDNAELWRDHYSSVFSSVASDPKAARARSFS